MTARVLSSGLLTTVQDLGRPGRQRDGIPVSGAMDHAALRIANLLVGNGEDGAALEGTLIGPALEFAEPALVAIAGADFDATIGEQPVPAWHAVYVPRGATLRVGAHGAGCRPYVAIAGGIDVPSVFGSRSTYVRAAFGGLEGRALRAGDVLHRGAPSDLSCAIQRELSADADRVGIARWTIGAPVRPHYSADPIVRVVEGAQTHELTDESRARLFGERFRVSASSDRMGYRLEDVKLALKHPIEMLSEGVAFGTIQLPPGGAPIVLMADRQTTGGYPRIGEVASVDLPLIAQLKPGDRVRFRLISLADAQRLYLAREADLTQARAAIALRYSRGRS
ncbi:MAG TPA: biotin-dependent carboxyltransferase family protein [Gemmatimonadaceae bacterium]|nr:biotin-dependent carboxyltransferase family protein [Gemmatimonadaceae bacterium]